jgi:uroporphyrin-III C-methyltransferase/precorrin-2 dehydrogenase/sirohydrochlorin ferrochelatase
MDYFPLFANLLARPCLVVGGGAVAARKVQELRKAGARVTVNAPELCEALSARLDIDVRAEPFDPRIIADHVLVIAATSDPETNRRVASAARACHRLCNVVDDGNLSSFIVPAVVDRSPVIVAVSSGGRAPLLARRIRQQLERWLRAQLGALAEWAGDWRERVRSALPPAARRAFWEEIFAGDASRDVFRGSIVEVDIKAEALLRALAHSPRRGKAWLVGAGPGDPGLVTVRGLEVIERADVVMHDRLVSPGLLRHARRDAEIVAVGKTGGGESARQQDINRLLIRQVRAGRTVCRLKGGDPFVFGRGGEEAEALAAAGLDFEIVPGITAANGAGAAAGIPLTHRGLSGAVTLVTARTAPGEPGLAWADLARLGHTLVVYMGGAQVGAIASELLRHGRASSTPAALVSRGTLPGETVVTGTLADIGARAAAAVPSPALLVVGETVAMADKLGHGRPRRRPWPDGHGLGDTCASGVPSTPGRIA